MLLINSLKSRKSLTLLCLVACLVSCGPTTPDSKEKERSGEEEFEQGTQVHQDSEMRLGSELGLKNLDEIIRETGLNRLYARSEHGRYRKIAIFDNGFADLNARLGKTLPPHLSVEPAPKQEMQDTIHGTLLAEAVYAITTGSVRYIPNNNEAPELLLYNTNGLKNLSYAVESAIAEGVNIILYAQVWEYGGNLDGTGFINKIFEPAIKANIKIAAAVGNYGKSAFQYFFTPPNQGSWVQFPNGSRFQKLDVSESLQNAKISLGWNDFTDDINYRTSQDLNLYLFDSRHQLIASNELIQDGRSHSSEEKQYSAHAREVIQTCLEPGTYYLGVKSLSHPKVFAKKPRLWLAVNGAGVVLEGSDSSSTTFIPADNPHILAAGASDVDYTSIAFAADQKTLTKPDFLTWSKLNFGENGLYDGSSAASGIAAAFLTVLDSGPYGNLTLNQVHKLLKTNTISDPKKDSKSGLTLPALRFK